MASILTVAPHNVQMDFEERLLPASTDGSDDKDLGPVIEDEVGNNFPLQKGRTRVRQESTSMASGGAID